jgi:hypothetical protein
MARDQYTGQVLFHGTRTLKAILTEDVLRAAGPNKGVSLSRCFNSAMYWACMPREPDEGSGAVLVLDRGQLRGPTVATIDLGWAGEDEHEEWHRGDLSPLSACLLGVVRVPSKFAFHLAQPTTRANLAAFRVGPGARPVLALQDEKCRHLAVTLRPRQTRDLIVALAQALA